jgi:hypothetical protein
MAKVIQLENGDRMIVSDHTPDDISYDDRGFDRNLAAEAAEKFKSIPKALVDPVALVLSFDGNNSKEIPIHLSSLKKDKTDRMVLHGTMVTSDLAWLLERKVVTEARMTFVTENNPYDIAGGSHFRIVSLQAKSINAVAASVRLSLVKTI